MPAAPWSHPRGVGSVVDRCVREVAARGARRGAEVERARDARLEAVRAVDALRAGERLDRAERARERADQRERGRCGEPARDLARRERAGLDEREGDRGRPEASEPDQRGAVERTLEPDPARDATDGSL
jgi:hypothetical protein